jgi:hypothetical protein
MIGNRPCKCDTEPRLGKPAAESLCATIRKVPKMAREWS